ncbi:hypothetical protein [Rhizobium leguminosarum]|uniref:hypothetical protein n=1 Tax=Rhizobium leguminosarum TaxID=384 RepID=UPI0011AE2699|nr:hypothetical protein [Rhizobium leguminosarum]
MRLKSFRQSERPSLDAQRLSSFWTISIIPRAAPAPSRLSSHRAKPVSPKIGASDSAAVRSIVEDVTSDKSPLRFERPAKSDIDSMVNDVSSSLKRSGPDYDMIDCLSDIEYFQRPNSAACDYAYAKVELILSKIADVVGWGVTRDEFPYVLQRGLEELRGRSRGGR